MLTIAVLGTFDTKGAEHAFVAESIRNEGCIPLLIDVGSSGSTTIVPDIDSETVFRFCNDFSNRTLKSIQDRGEAVHAMSIAAAEYIRDLVASRRIDGIISLGGTGGTAIGTAAMRSLPLGFPKVMVSTVAGGDVSKYLGISDIVMIPSIVDVSGINRFSRGVFARAAAVVCGMARANKTIATSDQDKPLIVASMFGNTTRCVEHAKKLLEEAGYEVLVFHATGIGGRIMESLIASGAVSGVLDITTTEWADELVGGILGAGPNRLEAAALNGIPAIVAPGCLDMVNFGEPTSVPKQFAGRRFYQHNPQITLMRTTPEECETLGRILASKINSSTGPVSVLIPCKAISVISAAGQPFHDPIADQRLFDSLTCNLASNIEVEKMDVEINDVAFASRCAEKLLSNIAARKQFHSQ